MSGIGRHRLCQLRAQGLHEQLLDDRDRYVSGSVSELRLELGLDLPPGGLIPGRGEELVALPGEAVGPNQDDRLLDVDTCGSPSM